ncbi:MAG: hypothetical protein NVS3B19_05270 [Ginsengibacter sp.]
MGPRLGIYNFKNAHYPYDRVDLELSRDYYPSKPLLKDDEWQNIIDYYTATSPDSIFRKNPTIIKSSLSLFEPVKQNTSLYTNASTSFLKIVESNPSYSIILSDVLKKTTYFLDKNFAVKDSLTYKGSIVDIENDENNYVACDIGVLNPNNGKHGKGVFFKNHLNSHLMLDSSEVFDSLRRPVQILPADLNKDGKMDYIICEFGFLNGCFSWMENKGMHKFEKHILRNVPGAIKAYVNDYNHDGLPDIWVLFAQADEGIFLFTNKGNGTFNQESILRFPPMYGSSYFELADFNKDGYPDILYTCGDNADYSPVLKPYHGVYIYMNDKTNHFKQSFFYPINGCYKAMARDFDNDGDLDIASISFFADYQHQPEEGFVYLRNNGNFNFTASSIPETQKGRWLSMDVGDIDGDGKIDIILGNFSIGPSLSKSGFDWKKYPPYLILRNTGKIN